jgi:Haem-binding domain
MKKIMRFIAITLVVVFVLMQFYPRATKNQDPATTFDISRIHQVPDSVQQILKTSCYDCHSNNTYYPWYSNIQPVSYWLNDHIVEGKKELNFSAFATYSVARQFKKMKEIAKEVKEDEMPLQSYTNIHRDAKLNAQQKLTLTSWATMLKDSMQNAYPADSLIAKKK